MLEIYRTYENEIIFILENVDISDWFIRQKKKKSLFYICNRSEWMYSINYMQYVFRTSITLLPPGLNVLAQKHQSHLILVLKVTIMNMQSNKK